MYSDNKAGETMQDKDKEHHKNMPYTHKRSKKMKTKKQVIKEHPGYRKLINAVISRIDEESIPDIINSGADAGFSGFIYYADTHKFAMYYRKQIISLLEETAEQLGEEVPAMVKRFGVFRHSPADADDLRELYKYLGGGRPAQGAITNVMAWFALEEVCRWFDE